MIRVFELDGIIINVDNDIDADNLLVLGATEIDADIFEDYGHLANNDNTTVDDSGAWTFDSSGAPSFQSASAALVAREWQQGELEKVNNAIDAYKRDMDIPDDYSALKITDYTESQYYQLLQDRKLLTEYVLQDGFPDCDRPTLSGVV